jgi:hypothetical protein
MFNYVSDGDGDGDCDGGEDETEIDGSVYLYARCK